MNFKLFKIFEIYNKWDLYSNKYKTGDYYKYVLDSITSLYFEFYYDKHCIDGGKPGLFDNAYLEETINDIRTELLMHVCSAKIFLGVNDPEFPLSNWVLSKDDSSPKLGFSTKIIKSDNTPNSISTTQEPDTDSDFETLRYSITNAQPTAGTPTPAPRIAWVEPKQNAAKAATAAEAAGGAPRITMAQYHSKYYPTYYNLYYKKN
jgi:hypothetical protein